MQRVIQIRIPKTASTSIETGLLTLRDKKRIKMNRHGHAKTTAIINEYYRKLPENPIIVASVRNPFGRLFSAYNYIIQCKQDKKNSSLKYIFDYPSFRDFCMDIHRIYERNQFFHPACRWLFNGEKRLYTDLIRFESLDHDWKKFLRKHSFPMINLPSRKKTHHKPWTKSYDPEMKKIVAKLYEEDFRRLNYNVH